MLRYFIVEGFCLAAKCETSNRTKIFLPNMYCTSCVPAFLRAVPSCISYVSNAPSYALRAVLGVLLAFFSIYYNKVGTAAISKCGGWMDSDCNAISSCNFPVINKTHLKKLSSCKLIYLP